MVVTIGTVLLVSIASWALIMTIFSLLARRPTNLGIRDGRLAGCPTTPNCVCSQDDDAGHAIEPLPFDGDPAQAWTRLKAVITRMPRTQIIAATEGYLHAECTSLVFRFVDDLECLLDGESRVIHVRSASRVGRSDLGVNRRRVEALRQAFARE